MRTGLRLCQEHWDVLCAAESQQVQWPEVGVLLRSVGWVWNTVVREALVQLSHHAFQTVCPEVQDIASCLVHSWGGTVVNERCFRALSDAKNMNSNRRVSRTRRYYAPITAKTLEQHGRDVVGARGGRGPL